MKLLPEPGSTDWSFPFTEQDWDQTPPAVKAYLQTLHHEIGQLHERVESLEARLKQDSTTSSKPPSSDSHAITGSKCESGSAATRARRDRAAAHKRGC